MSVIDENKLKLLKMKERLLEISFDNRNSVLADYKLIAIEIDNILYKSITDIIKSNVNYTDKPLEEQLELFLKIEKEYADYDKFQQDIKNVCKKYNDDVNLSDIDSILIEEIRKKIQSIKKYLSNKKNLEENRKKLDELNTELINEDKKMTSFKKRIDDMDAELKLAVLKTEGRIYNSSSQIEYADISLEADNLGLNLRNLLDDDSLLEEELNKALAELKDAEDELKTAQICYDNRPNINYKDIYLSIREDAVKKKYRFLFLKIISVICKHTDSYDEAYEKRIQLISLIKDRSDLLKQLNVKYLYDPFDRIGLKEQTEVIVAYGNNSSKVKDIRKQIEEVSSSSDLMETENIDLNDYLSKNIDLIRDNTLFKDIIDKEKIDLRGITYEDDTLKRKYASNQVVSVDALPFHFMTNRAKEKANGVVNRVYEMMFNIDNEKTSSVNSSSLVNPQLVIEPTSDNELTKPFDSTKETVSDNFETEDEVFLDLPFTIDVVSPEEKNDSIQEQHDEVTTNTVGDDISVSVEDKQSEPPLFQEVQPFENISLFDDKYDDGLIFDNKLVLKDDNVKKENETKLNNPVIQNLHLENKENGFSEDVMPDAFWTVKEEEPDLNEDNKLSFDEQIAALVESEDNSKVKKLVA